MKFIQGDQVKITAGRDKGKTGEITRVLPKKNSLIVKGVNISKRHLKSREGVEGGIITITKPVSIAKLALICPTCNQPTRIGYRTPPKGRKVRVCRKCSAELVVKSKLEPKTTTSKTTKQTKAK